MHTLPYAGQRFGRLRYIKLIGTDKGHRTWLCQCDCGKVLPRIGSLVRNGSTRSCGCLKAGRPRVSGQCVSNHPLYRTWIGMLNRCNNPNSTSYHRYGGRGIRVNYTDFEAFVESMGSRPHGSQIDRVDNNGDYDPSNCRWVTPKQNSRNRERHMLVSWRGATLCLSEWSEKLGFRWETLKWRLDHWGDVDRAFTEPLEQHVWEK